MIYKDGKNISVYDRIPVSILQAAVGDNFEANALLSEYTEIEKYYAYYKEGIKPYVMVADDTKANESYKQITSLINKEARFMFSRVPDFNVNPRGNIDDLGEDERKRINVLQDFLNEVLKKNKIGKKLSKAARDCFIGKRVGWVVNFNEVTGITVIFLKSMNFYVEYDSIDSETIKRFVYYVYTKKNTSAAAQRIFVKEYYMNNNGKCAVMETLYDGSGAVVEDAVEIETDFTYIPCGVIVNDGLLGEAEGVSEVAELKELEKLYNKLSSKDIDAENGTMNPIKYLIDISPRSTAKLTGGVGATWDLSSDEAKDEPKPSVGVLAPPMTHTEAMEKTLERTRSAMYDLIDMPDVSMDNLTGTITSGKGMTAVYWNLMVRCDEKMQTWGAELEAVIKTIIDGALLNPNIASKYTYDILQVVNYTPEVIANYAIQQDEIEEKTSDMAEVNLNIMSRREYNKKWRKMTDKQTEEEIQRIVEESTMLDSAMSFGENDPVPLNEDENAII